MLLEHFASEFNAKLGDGQDVRSSPRAMAKLRKQVGAEALARAPPPAGVSRGLLRTFISPPQSLRLSCRAAVIRWTSLCAPNVYERPPGERMFEMQLRSALVRPGKGS